MEKAPDRATIKGRPPTIPSLQEQRELVEKLGRIVVEYGRFVGRGLLDDAAKMAVSGEVVEVDAYGMDSVYRERMRPLLDFLFNEYFRVEVIGIENIPAKGKACMVVNHSGLLPYDGLMLSHALENLHPGRRIIRCLVDDFFTTSRWLAKIFTRYGMVRASQENGQRLLEEGNAVAVFPEGLKGISKYYRNRYQLQRFGRGGFVRLCYRTRAPLIPVAVTGAEEIHPVVAKMGWLERRLDMFIPPFTATFPWLGLLGLLPLPSKWYIDIGKPIDLVKEGVSSEDDDISINRVKESVRTQIQWMLYERLKSRRSVWRG